ncbi:AbrB/MazE/SpoVT family DNA-binding domain-containing protein [Natronomonas sp.]|uniref:AbrB/MazE/SpoVT family DNA-binding domain-containing protein n=1 Tax=Natronomonas sp. TaxID=2184060 RepID=UPI003976255E
MTKVDSKGRVVLPKRVRDRLGITAGSEVEIREQDGRVVVEPEDDPSDIIEDVEALIESAAADRTRTPYDDLDTQSKAHVDAIQRQSVRDETADE